MDHFTPEDIAITIINNISIEENSIILDPCSGLKKVFYDNFPDGCVKFECEIDENKDFFNFHERVDYIIANPPYRLQLLWQFIDHSMDICDKEVYFLINVDCLNVFTKKRYKIVKDKGFSIYVDYILEIPIWYGRYIVLCISKKRQNGIKFLI